MAGGAVVVAAREDGLGVADLAPMQPIRTIVKAAVTSVQSGRVRRGKAVVTGCHDVWDIADFRQWILESLTRRIPCTEAAA
jgi:hypothetical protein